ncbi:MAG: DUF934 domain-containing protein [Alphaproteobacteria bacterium]|jgi:uncharacterized protein (DUF934 family)
MPITKKGPLIKDGAVIADPWMFIADDEPIPVSSPIIVSLTRWLAERDALRGRNGLTGVQLRTDDLAEVIAADLDCLDLVAIEFPSIGDGRGYTTGRLLRERYGFTGELRAVGPLIRDVFRFLQRCGFDAVEARDEAEAAAWHEAVGAITVAYQNATDHNDRLDNRGQQRAIFSSAPI